jgi:hypothetical protein
VKLPAFTGPQTRAQISKRIALPHHPAPTARRGKAYRFEHLCHIKQETAMVPTLRLNNGVEMPALGFGVFQTPPEETTAAVTAALEVGYRHIDSAAAYGNERGVGNAVSRSDLDRVEVFLETKIWITDYGYDTLATFERPIPEN